jgi:cytochrome c peroxidase
MVTRHKRYAGLRQRHASLLIGGVLCGLLAPALLSAHTWSPPPGYTPPAPGTYALPVVKPATDGEVVDITGVRHRLFDYMDGKIVLLSFIYTRCSEARGCPLATGVLHAIAEALQQHTTLARHVRLLTLSFDPEHDSPEVMRRYAGAGATAATAPLWHHLTAVSVEALQPILDGYGQYIVPILEVQGRFTGTYTHLLKVFLIDRQQRVRNIYSVDFLHPQVLLNDVETLLMADDNRQVR